MNETLSFNGSIGQAESNDSQKAGQFRIIYIDDENWVLQMTAGLIRTRFPNTLIEAFQNRDKAWEQLQRAEPDLLITDLQSDNVPGRTEQFGKSGFELLELLANRNVKFPILVLSGSLARPGVEAKARQCAEQLNVSFLMKPATPEQICAVLGNYIRIKNEFARRHETSDGLQNSFAAAKYENELVRKAGYYDSAAGVSKLVAFWIGIVVVSYIVIYLLRQMFAN